MFDDLCSRPESATAAALTQARQADEVRTLKRRIQKLERANALLAEVVVELTGGSE